MSDVPFDWGGCLDRVRTDDHAAACELVQQLHPLVAKIVRSHLPAGSDPQDLIQDVFVRMFERLDQYRGEAPMEHWVSRIAVSTCLNRLRSHLRRPTVTWSDLSESDQRLIEALSAEAPVGPELEPDAWKLLGRLLDQLSPTERLLITWLDLEEKTIAEVSALTGWNRGVVRIRAFRARRKLRQFSEQLEECR